MAPSQVSRKAISAAERRRQAGQAWGMDFKVWIRDDDVLRHRADPGTRRLTSAVYQFGQQARRFSTDRHETEGRRMAKRLLGARVSRCRTAPTDILFRRDWYSLRTCLPRAKSCVGCPCSSDDQCSHVHRVRTGTRSELDAFSRRKRMPESVICRASLPPGQTTIMHGKSNCRTSDIRHRLSGRKLCL